MNDYCDEVVFYDTQPESAEEIVSRIGDADCNFCKLHTCDRWRHFCLKCPNLKYIGMCCSLYSEAKFECDIAYAENMEL